eukprot:736472-Pelagomonas_calceolata.AAC.5
MDYDMLLGASKNGARNQTLQLKVALVPDRSCWIALPVGLCNQLYSSNCMPPLIFRLAPGAVAGLGSRTSPGGSSAHNFVYVAWGGGTCAQKAAVEGIRASMICCVYGDMGLCALWAGFLPRAASWHVLPHVPGAGACTNNELE